MKVGDLVRLVRVLNAGQIGIIIDNSRVVHNETRFDLIMIDGRAVKDITQHYLEVISESK